MSADIDFPLIYCNGDSYSDENYYPALKGNTYANAVGQACGGFVINQAISGSCNRRIIRTTVHDMMQQRQLNPDQKIIALIGLSFELRSELWIDDIDDNRRPEESNLRTHTFSGQLNWRENLLKDLDINSPNKYAQHNKFFEKFSQGRAFFFSPYAERINLLCDLIMLRALFDSLNIHFIIFQSPVAEKLQSDYLLDFFKKQIAEDSRFLDLENFGFCNWCIDQGFVPLDFLDRPNIGHHGPEAHIAFAEKILIPKLKQLKILS
jgi:hypothetical protein